MKITSILPQDVGQMMITESQLRRMKSPSSNRVLDHENGKIIP